MSRHQFDGPPDRWTARLMAASAEKQVQDKLFEAKDAGQVTPALVLRSSEGQRILVERAPFRIGRHGDNDLTLLLPELSSFHAELRLGDNLAWLVVDVGSTNGTFVNGEAVKEPTSLHTGDTLHLGGVRFTVSFAQTLLPQIPKTQKLGAHETVQAAIELAGVIAKQRVVSHFQPMVGLQHGDRVVGWEALARPGTKAGGGPAGLLTLAEAHRQAAALSEVFARSAAECALCRHCWPAAEQPLLFFNFHPEQLKDGSLPGLLEQPPLSELSRWYRLVIEIPEELACEANQMAGWIAQLRQGGYFVAYDDFGKGQSRIAELLSAPPDFIKLDRALVQDLDSQPTKRRLVQGVLEACQELHVQTIAEGIETAAEAEACRALGVDIGQGYLLGRPAPAYALFEAVVAELPESCQYRRLELI